MVKAKHYVRIAGRTYAPGDMIEYNLPAVDLDFLVKKGAIEVMEPASAPEKKEAEPEFVFTPMEEKEEAFSEEDDVLDDIVAPAKKKTARKKG